MTTRLATTLDYDQWRLLLREFIDEVAGADADLKVTMEWTLETWLQWLRKRQETTNGKEDDKSTISTR